jgi:prevent-host-death family protein
MMEKKITVSEAARHFAKYVKHAHQDGDSFIIIKNGKPVAKLMPICDRPHTGRELAKALAGIRLSHEEAVAWQKDLKEGLEFLQPPADKWQA